jgi:hypothetical protein
MDEPFSKKLLELFLSARSESEVRKIIDSDPEGTRKRRLREVHSEAIHPRFRLKY